MKSISKQFLSFDKLDSLFIKSLNIIKFNFSLFILSFSVPIAIIFSIMVGLNIPVFLLNENQIFYLFSTASQVIAGLFGLTVTGYVFLRNELDHQSKDDDSITDAVNALRSKYFKLVGFLSIIGFFAILFSFIAISVENDILSIDKVTYFMNIAGSLSVIEIAAIFYFAFNMLDPNRIEKISTSIKKTFGQKAKDRGSLEEFMRDFNELESILQGFYFRNKSTIDNAMQRPINISNMKLVNELVFSERIDLEFKEKLMALIKYRNSVVHGKDLAISSEDNKWVRSMLEELRTKIQ